MYMAFCRDFGLNPYDPTIVKHYDGLDYEAYRELQNENPIELPYDRNEMLLFAIYACLETIINGFSKKGSKRFQILAHKSLHLTPYEQDQDDTLSEQQMLEENKRLAEETRRKRIIENWKKENEHHSDNKTMGNE